MRIKTRMSVTMMALLPVAACTSSPEAMLEELVTAIDERVQDIGAERVMAAFGPRRHFPCLRSS